MKHIHRGMTLVELMIVVVIVALLASIAVPGYRNYIIRSTRTEAKTALLRIQAAQEKYYLQNNKYADDLDDLNIDEMTENGNYTLALDPDEELLNQGFVASAAPTAGSGQARDKDCMALAIDHAGKRTATPAGVDKCWR